MHWILLFLVLLCLLGIDACLDRLRKLERRHLRHPASGNSPAYLEVHHADGTVSRIDLRRTQEQG